jgi:hypothetical protein
MKKYSHLRIITLASTLAYATDASAEAALGDLIFMLPTILAVGFYDWLVKIYWWLFGATAVTWAWYLLDLPNPFGWLFGKEKSDGLLTHIYPGNRGKRVESPHIFLLIFCIFATLYIAVGSAFIGFHSERTRKIAAEKTLNSPKEKSPPIPEKPLFNAPTRLPVRAFDVNTIPPENPANKAWPKESSYLISLSADQQNGTGTIAIAGGKDTPIYIKLCATADENCQAVRHIFKRPGETFVLNNIPDGIYSLRYIEINKPQHAIARSQNFELVSGLMKGNPKKTTWTVMPAQYLRDDDGADDFYRYETRKF